MSTGTLQLRPPAELAPRPLPAPSRPPRSAAARLPRRTATAVVLIVIGVVAAVVRLRLLGAPTPFFSGVYDDGVHFATALNFVHGRMPYRDALFLQPPGIVLATSPFALLASVIGDAHAFVLARIAFALIGAVNAVLVGAVLRRLGLVAALSGGLIFALSWSAVFTERTISLEVLGTTGVLTALLLLQVDDGRRRWPLLAGLAAGVAVDVKVWYVAVVLLLALRAWRRSAPFLVGITCAGLAGYLPFFVLAPASMWRDIVTAQLGRPDQGIPITTRIRSILGLDFGAPDRPWWQVAGPVGVALILVLLAFAVVLAVTRSESRFFVALLGGTGAVLLLSPSYLQHYAALTAAPLALVGGAAAGRAIAWIPGRWSVVPGVAAVVLVAGAAFAAPDLGIRSVEDPPLQKVLPLAALRVATDRIDGCVVSDDPTALILIDRFSRDLDHGCTVQADPSGIGFTLTAPGAPQLRRPDNPAFQREVVRYLHSADAYLLVRGRGGLGSSPATQARFKHDRVLARVHGIVIRTGRG